MVAARGNFGSRWSSDWPVTPAPLLALFSSGFLAARVFQPPKQLDVDKKI